MVLIGFPLSWILKLALLKIGLTFSLHLVVSPLTFIVGPTFFELIFSFSMLCISSFLSNVLTSDSFIINLVNSIQILPILFLASHSLAYFAVVPAGYRHARIIWTDISTIDASASWVRSRSTRISAFACTLPDTSWIVS